MGNARRIAKRIAAGLGGTCPSCGADNGIVNQCGCDPDNMPTTPTQDELGLAKWESDAAAAEAAGNGALAAEIRENIADRRRQLGDWPRGRSTGLPYNLRGE